MSSSRPADDPIAGSTQEFIDSLIIPRRTVRPANPFESFREGACTVWHKLFNYAREFNGRAPSNVPAGDSPPGYDWLSDPYSASAIASVNNASSPLCFKALSGSEMCSTFTSV